MPQKLLLVVCLLAAPAFELDCESRRDVRFPPIEYRDSIARGAADSGSLEKGVLLPREGRSFFTWDPARREKPNRAWRRWATDDTIRTTLSVLRGYRRDHPRAARVGIGDLSRRHGGSFDKQVSPGYSHASHQNGLDVDVYYPLKSGRERGARKVAEVDVRRAQDLVDRFVDAGATLLFVGTRLPLKGPGDVVAPLEDHNDHLHVRFAPERERRDAGPRSGG
jgi:murein endopeptidase